MSKLLDLQNDFLNGIFQKDEAILKHIGKNGDISPEQRLQIYQNNAYLILTEVLRDAFPAVNKIVSDNFFNYTVNEFIKSSPPTGGDINNYGADLPSFLDNFSPLQEHQYIGDLARLEWMRHKSYLSHSLNNLDTSNLETENIEAMVLTIQPHVHLLKSVWPIDKIYELGTTEKEPETDLNMDNNPSNLVIFQKDMEIVVWSVAPALFVFLRSCENNKNFKEALSEAIALDNKFMESNFLGELINEGIFSYER